LQGRLDPDADQVDLGGRLGRLVKVAAAARGAGGTGAARPGRRCRCHRLPPLRRCPPGHQLPGPAPPPPAPPPPPPPVAAAPTPAAPCSPRLRRPPAPRGAGWPPRRPAPAGPGRLGGGLGAEARSLGEQALDRLSGQAAAAAGGEALLDAGDLPLEPLAGL